MNTESDGFFGQDIARTYDRDHGGNDPALIRQTTKVLAELAGEGSILEFAIGTGRIALPLAATGRTVKGIELSRAMIRELRKKEGVPPLEVQIGDMMKVRVPGAFSLVYLIFNTIDNLTTQDAQVACFENAARHLTRGGRFVVETQVPPLQRLPVGETKLAFSATDTHFGVEEIDVVTQAHVSHHVWMDGPACRTLSIPFRYAWPAELDLMARIAGLVLEERWSDWNRTPFDRYSAGHVSVWRKT
ncbi:MAG: class I SAM-dependent methyltransferase [Pseudomonadota bacterium]